MSKCQICGIECGRGRTCSSTCRSKLHRSVAAIQQGLGTQQQVTEPVKVLQKQSVALNKVLHGQSVASSVAPGITTPEGEVSEVPENYGEADCQCLHCKQARTNKSRNVLNHGAYKPASKLGPNELNRVSLPGDCDYTGEGRDVKYLCHRIAQTAKG